MHLLKSSNGLYIFSFFNIFLETDIEPEKLDLNIELQTIIHEYVHFLQDISTIYGLTNTSKVAREIEYIYRNNYQNKNRKLKIPLSFDYDSEKIKAINDDLFSLYFSRCDEDKISKLLDVEILCEENGIIPDHKEVKQYAVRFHGKDYSKKFDFGAYAILESMAALLERFLYPEEHTTYHVPYDLAYVVAKNYYTLISDDPGALFSLCDVCLMYYHPSDIFINSLKMMKEQCFTFDTYQQIYSFVFESVQTSSSIKESYRESVHDAMRSIFNIQNTSSFTYASKWITRNIDAFGECRMDNMSFLSKIFNFKSISAARIYMLKMISLLGSPIIYNMNGDYFALRDKDSDDRSEEDQMLFWIIAENIYKIFKLQNPDFSCSLYNICKDNKDSICNSHPWDKVHKMNHKCFFKHIWDAWGLEGKKIE